MIPLEISPEFDLPKLMSGAEHLTINDKFSGKIIYEVVGKNKQTIRLRVKVIVVNDKVVRV